MDVRVFYFIEFSNAQSLIGRPAPVEVTFPITKLTPAIYFSNPSIRETNAIVIVHFVTTDSIGRN